MRVWVIDDDIEAGTDMVAGIRRALPDAKISLFTDIYARIGSFEPVDWIVIDISSVCPLGAGVHRSYAPICSLIGPRPGVQVAIISAIRAQAMLDIKERIIHALSQAIVHIVPWKLDIDNAMYEFFKEKDRQGRDGLLRRRVVR